jgi:hypothetical protein
MDLQVPFLSTESDSQERESGRRRSLPGGTT